MIDQAVDLLMSLVRTPSLSRSEDAAADIVQQHLACHGIAAIRIHNNTWAVNKHFSPTKPTLLLNSHIDTVKPSPSYSFHPYDAHISDGKLYGLGSNDAGGCVVALISTFIDLYEASDLPCNLLLAITAEEEVSGEKGTRAFLPEMERLGIKIDMGIVGEPTSLQPAVAERGLVVLDCVAHGKAGHAARNEGINAIYKALKDIEILRNMQFPKVSDTLGPIKISVTQIEAGSQHNVVPDSCKFVVDMRTTDAYTNAETVEIVRNAIESEAMPRSTRIQASVIDSSHPLVQAAIAAGGTPYVSPTTSDMALMHHFPTLKIGPGDSARSHTADEYIAISEIAAALDLYPRLIYSATDIQ